MHNLSTIVCVEDNQDDQDLFRYAYRKVGIENPLLMLSDGEQAVHYVNGTGAYADRLSNPLPALWLLDLKLPRRSGFEILGTVRGTAETKLTPVVVFTSSNQQDDIERAYALGANSYLVKPVDQDGLQALSARSALTG